MHGVELIDTLGRGFTTNGGDNTVTMFDLESLAVLDRIRIPGDNPDAVLYDPASKRLFTFNGSSKDATVIDPATAKVVGSIDLGGKPETGVADGTGRVYVNIEDASELKVFDAGALEVTATWPLTPCEEPTGLASTTRRIACSLPAATKCSRSWMPKPARS